MCRKLEYRRAKKSKYNYFELLRQRGNTTIHKDTLSGLMSFYLHKVGVSRKRPLSLKYYTFKRTHKVGQNRKVKIKTRSLPETIKQKAVIIGHGDGTDSLIIFIFGTLRGQRGRFLKNVTRSSFRLCWVWSIGRSKLVSIFKASRSVGSMKWRESKE